MSARELDAAGITGPALRASYEACRRLNADHGQTYYLATLLLPPAKRPAVHALYGFARSADEIVDDLGSSLTGTEKAELLASWGERILGRSPAADPVTAALRDTIGRYEIPHALFEAFLASMRMDLTIREYATHEELAAYVYGSAAVIGLQMLPVLGHGGVPYDVVAPYARDLGTAFQLANFLRDVGEDLRRGRIYLPQESLALFGVTREHLQRGVVDAPVRRLLAHEIARAREVFRRAAPGVRLLDPTSRDCVATALTLYAGILDAVEAADYRVLDRRVRVSAPRRAAVAGPGLYRAWRARRAPLPLRSAGG
ncbi:MAG TPA: phytoene/squalene synthase family protein [Mycobacteriales bacterium]|nr:phytoene/squalene synthase family protein [Mycobacteriales bacterium]